MDAVIALLLLGLGTDASRPEAAIPPETSAGEASAKPASHLIDMVVAQVDAAVITLSELVAETRLVLLRTGDPEVARASFLSQGLLNAVLKSIVSRELLLGEVRRLKLRDVPDPEVRQSLDKIRTRFADDADYERFLVKSGFREPGSEMMPVFDAPASLVAILTAELQVERFLDVRVRRGAPVKESDVALCYEANRVQFAGRSLADVRSEIEARLGEQEHDRAVAALLEQLARRATIRYAAGFEPSEPIGTVEAPMGIACPASKGASPRRE